MNFRFLIIPIIGFLGIGASACGDASKTVSSSQTSASTRSTTTSSASTGTSALTTEGAKPAQTNSGTDGQNNVGSSAKDNNSTGSVSFGQTAGTADRQAITRLIKSYYAAAASEDGAKACSMIYSTLAESVPEDYGQTPPGPVYAHGRTCPEVMNHMFAHFHSQLAHELPMLRVVRIGLVEHHGLAELSFGSPHKHQIPVAREGRVWKVQALLDSEIQ